MGLYRNPKVMQGIAIALIVLGLLNALLGQPVSGLIVAAAGAVIFIRRRFFPTPGRREP